LRKIREYVIAASSGGQAARRELNMDRSGGSQQAYHLGIALAVGGIID